MGLDEKTAYYFLDKDRNHFLSDLNEVRIVDLGAVKLARGTLGAVCEIYVLFTEVPFDIEDTVEHAH